MNSAENISMARKKDSLSSPSVPRKDLSKKECRYINHYLTHDTSTTMNLSKFHAIRDKILEDAKREKLEISKSIHSSRASKMQKTKKYRSESSLNVYDQPPPSLTLANKTSNMSSRTLKVEEPIIVDSIPNEQCDTKQTVTKSRFSQWAMASYTQLNSRFERMKNNKQMKLSKQKLSTDRETCTIQSTQSDETDSQSTSASTSSSPDRRKELLLCQWESKRLRGIIETILEGEVSVDSNNNTLSKTNEYCFHDGAGDGSSFCDMLSSASTSTPLSTRNEHNSRYDDICYQIKGDFCVVDGVYCDALTSVSSTQLVTRSEHFSRRNSFKNTKHQTGLNFKTNNPMTDYEPIIMKSPAHEIEESRYLRIIL